MRVLFFVITGAVLLTGCAQPDVSHAELNELIADHLVSLADGEFGKLPSEVTNKEIIFLGEQHRVPALHKATYKLACYLAQTKPLVYAYEAVYGAHPFLEASSLGKPDPLWPLETPQIIKEFNASQPPERKILITSVDIEHTIYHGKPKTVLFLRHLAGRSTSAAARQSLEQKIVDLPSQDTYDKMEAYLVELKTAFVESLDTFSPEDQDEILFTMELLDASNRYRYASLEKENLEIWNSAIQIRYPFFIETIERALKKAQQRNAALLCRVGDVHVTGNFEARYFAEENSETKGKVARVCFVQIPGDPGRSQSDIDTAVETMMQDNTYCYLSLIDLKKAAKGSFAWSNFFHSDNSPVCDGLLFVRNEPPGTN